jgi:hypothetical protein
MSASEDSQSGGTSGVPESLEEDARAWILGQEDVLLDELKQLDAAAQVLASLDPAVQELGLYMAPALEEKKHKKDNYLNFFREIPAQPTSQSVVEAMLSYTTLGVAGGVLFGLPMWYKSVLADRAKQGKFLTTKRKLKSAQTPLSISPQQIKQRGVRLLESPTLLKTVGFHTQRFVTFFALFGASEQALALARNQNDALNSGFGGLVTGSLLGYRRGSVQAILGGLTCGILMASAAKGQFLVREYIIGQKK